MAKSEDLHGDRTLYELRRQYHCHAYNMLVAVITCTQSKVQFYTGFLFKEDPLKVGVALLANHTHYQRVVILIMYTHTRDYGDCCSNDRPSVCPILWFS